MRELLNWCQVVQRCRNQVSPVPVLPGGGFQSLRGSQEHEESVASFSTGFSTLGLGLSSRGVLVERSGRENGRKARSAEKSKDLGGGRATEMVWDWVRAGGELLRWLEAFKTKKLLKPKSFSNQQARPCSLPRSPRCGGRSTVLSCWKWKRAAGALSPGSELILWGLPCPASGTALPRTPLHGYFLS